MIIRRITAARLRASLVAVATLSFVLAIAGCAQRLYVIPEFNFGGRPTPPSLLQERVMVAYTTGVSGALQILDGFRDLRNNVQNTQSSFSISGYSGTTPTTILNFPAEVRGYVYSSGTGFPLNMINYGTEAAGASAGTFTGPSSQFAIAPDFQRIFSAEEQNGQLIIIDNGPTNSAGAYALNLPNVYRVAVNSGDTVALAMTRNSNNLYRIVKLNAGSTANPPGAVDCQPTLLPIYCVVPVPGTYDRPQSVSYSLDGSTAYVLNCGIECGGGTNGGASVTTIPQGSLQILSVPTSLPLPAVATKTVPIPGGVTTSLSDGTNLYLAGQSLNADGLFSGNLTLLNLATMTASAPISISDGTHTKMLFADDNTLWIGSSYCATGERFKQGQNYNCLTRFDVGAKTASIVPNVTPNGSTPVPFPNQDGNQFYYGSLTGLCWVQNYHKVYTAYGGQVHAFHTVDGSEINNQFITVQGTALDVAYIDALSDAAN